MQWLFGRFHAVLEEGRGASSQGSTQIEVTSRLSELYPLIEERHASLPRDLNTVGGDDEDDHLDEPIFELCDILSSFDEGRTPTEYKRDFVENEQPLTSLNDILVPENISGTIYRLAIYDGAFYRRLRQVVPTDFCAVSYVFRPNIPLSIMFWRPESFSTS